MDKICDLIIIGSGPAGITASIYASRYKLDHLIFGMEPGGQMKEIYDIENWPGELGISGRDLISKFIAHMENFGVKVKNESVVSIKKETDFFELETSNGKYQSKMVIMAMGAEYRRMHIPGEKEYIGKGVSYCATCDAPFFKNKIVTVVGSGNSAVVVALELADFAEKVYLISREKILADPAWLEKLDKSPKIERIAETQVLEIKGSEKVSKIILDKPYGDKTYLEIDGVFIEIGTEPGVQLAQKLGVATDDGDYIKVGNDMITNIHGLFAAGDITTGSNKFRQVITACAEGAIAASSAYRMLKLK